MKPQDVVWLTVPEVACLLGVCEETIRRWCRSRRIMFQQAMAGGTYHIPSSALTGLQRVPLVGHIKRSYKRGPYKKRAKE